MRLYKHTRITLAGFVVGALLATAAATPSANAANSHDHHHGHIATAYSLELLAPASTDASSTALGINDNGDVVGIIRPTSSAQPQFTALWERHNDHFHRHQLSNLEGSQFSRGFALSANRTIVGEAFNSSGNTIPIRWDIDRTPNHVTNLNDVGTGILNDISAAGTAVGTASGTGVVLEADGVVRTLSAPTTTVANATVTTYSAQSISDQTIAGRAVVSEPHGDHSHNYSHPVIWNDGAATLLPRAPGASNTTVAGVNASAIVVGSSTISNTETALIWDTTGQVSTLTNPTIPDLPHTAAKAINNDQLVVGYASKFAGNTSFGGAAVIWDAHGSADLNTLVKDIPEAVTLQAASDINESGQIVGTATTSDGQRGFILSPIPDEPVHTTVTITGAADHYHPGDEISLSALQTPQTNLDHYHWFTRPHASANWALAAGSDSSGTFTSTAQIEQDGHQVLVRLYDNAHAVVAESAPITLRVTDHGDHHTPGPGDQSGSTVPTATVTASDVVSRFGKRATLVVRVHAAGKNVTGTVRISGPTMKALPLTLINGTATARLPQKLSVGRHTFTVSYLGSTTAKAATTKVNLRVKKARTKVKASATAKRVRLQGNRPRVKIRVLTPGTKLRAAGKVRLQINGKTARTVRLRQGAATVRLPRVKSARSLRIKAQYLGNKNFSRASSKIIKVRVRR